MIDWNARIEVVDGERRLGWAHIEGLRTAALPRQGEMVSFNPGSVSDELLQLVALSPVHAPIVTGVEHLVQRDKEALVQVVIRASAHAQPSGVDIAVRLREIPEGWTPAA